jgi:hypothetical protein
MTYQELKDLERAEALDPNTPARRLLVLLRFHCDEVLANPALPLVLLEQPDFWACAGHDGLQKAARSGLCPQAVVDWLLSSPAHAHLLGDLMKNRGLADATRRAAFLRCPDVEPRVEPEAFLPADEAALLRRSRHGPDPTMTEGELQQLAGLGVLGLGRALDHPRCPEAVLGAARQAGQWLQVVLRHPALPAAWLAEALAAGTWAVRSQALLNPRLTEAQFEVAATGPDRDQVALNPALPEVWRERLTSDAAVAVREAVARHPLLSPRLQWFLADDPIDTVRSALARNPALTAEAQALLEDAHARHPRFALRGRFRAPRVERPRPAVVDRPRRLRTGGVTDRRDRRDTRYFLARVETESSG